MQHTILIALNDERIRTHLARKLAGPQANASTEVVHQRTARIARQCKRSWCLQRERDRGERPIHETRYQATTNAA